MPEGRPLSVAWVQLRADGSRLGPDVVRESEVAGTKAGTAVKGGFVAGFKGASQEVIQEFDKSGGQAATGFRGKLQDGMRKVSADGEAAGREHGTRFSEGATHAVREHESKLSETIKEGFKSSLGALSAGLIGIGAIEVFKHFIEGAAEARKASALTEAVIRSTGGAAHVTGEDVDKLALALSNKTGVDDDVVHSGENVLLTFTNVRNELGRGNDVFDRATKAALDYSVATGRDMTGASRLLGRALNDPIKGMSLLARTGITFTDQQKEQIKTLTQSGHLLQAQGIILDAFGSRFGGAAEAAATPLQKLQTRIENLGKSAAGALLPVVDKIATALADQVIPAIAAVGSVIASIPGPVYAMGAALVAGRIALNLFGKAMVAVAEKGGAVAALRAGIGSIVSLLGGPWGIAFTAAAVGIGLWMKSQQDAKARVEDLTNAIREDSGAIGENTRAHVSARLESEGLLLAAQKLGISVGTVTDAVLGNSDALARIRAVTGGVISSTQAMSDKVRGGKTAFSEQNKAAHTLSDGVSGLTGDLKDANSAYAQQVLAAQRVAAATKESARETGTARLQTQLDTAVKKANKLAQDAETASLTKWLSTLDAQLNKFLGLRGAQRDYRQAIDDATKAIKDNGRNLDINSAKGRTNQAALDNVAAASGKVLDQMQANNARGPTFRNEWEHQRTKLYDVARQFGLNKTAAQNYVDDALGKVPPSVSTRVSTPGLAQAKQDIRNLGVQIQALRSKTLEVRIDSHGNAILHDPNVGGHKAGGYISGPGGPRDDRVPAMLSNGEFVVNAAATSRHREVLEAINTGRGYSAGGVVRSLSVNVRDRLPTALVADILRQVSPTAVLGLLGTASAGTAGFTGTAGGNAANMRLGQSLAASYGWVGSQWMALRSLWMGESGWNNRARNPSSGAFGIPQALPPGKMGAAAAAGNAYAQIIWGLRYIRDVYGNPGNAWGKWNQRSPHWYDAGGVATGTGLMAKYTAEPERVLSPAQTKAFEAWMRGGTQLGGSSRQDMDYLADRIVAGVTSGQRRPINLDGHALVGAVEGELARGYNLSRRAS